MKFLPKRFLIFLLTLLMMTATSVWAATIFNGSLLSTQGELISDWKTPSGEPSATSLSWRVSFLDSEQLWQYDYTFTGSKPDISHGIIEVSENFSGLRISEGGNIAQGTSPFESGDPKIYNDNAQGGSNPSIPGDLFGIKFENQASWTIVTNKTPMWGDFYANGASTGYAYNSGFSMDTLAEIGNGNAGADGYAWALVPDTTQVVPIPGALWLFGAGLFGFFRIRNKQ